MQQPCLGGGGWEAIEYEARPLAAGHMLGSALHDCSAACCCWDWRRSLVLNAPHQHVNQQLVRKLASSLQASGILFMSNAMSWTCGAAQLLGEA